MEEYSVSSQAILNRLHSLHPKTIDLSLDRMYRLLDDLNNPHKQLHNVISIAGTNGKGSVCENLRALLQVYNQSVNCYTSPHLIHFSERINIHGKPIDESLLISMLSQVEIKNNGLPITFFEATTATAFLAFAKKSANYTLLECGLGGRLDATNVIDKPLVTILTKISFDHQEYLGDTLAQIAYEKSGLIKPLSPVVSASQEQEVIEVIKSKADKLSCPLYIYGKDFFIEECIDCCVFHLFDKHYTIPFPALRGKHQLENLALALFTYFHIIDTDRALEEKKIQAAMENVCWPARLMPLPKGQLHKFLPNNSEIWLDGGHNEDAAKIIKDFLLQQDKKPEVKRILLWAMLENKQHEQFIQCFQDIFDQIIICPIPSEPKSADVHVLAKIAQKYCTNVIPTVSLEDACVRVKELHSGERIVIWILGSLYFAGHVLETHQYNPSHL